MCLHVHIFRFMAKYSSNRVQGFALSHTVHWFRIQNIQAMMHTEQTQKQNQNQRERKHRVASAKNAYTQLQHIKYLSFCACMCVCCSLHVSRETQFAF